MPENPEVQMQEFIEEIEKDLETALKLKDVLSGPVIKIELNEVQERELAAQIHTLEGVLKIARETFNDIDSDGRRG